MNTQATMLVATFLDWVIASGSVCLKDCRPRWSELLDRKPLATMMLLSVPPNRFLASKCDLMAWAGAGSGLAPADLTIQTKPLQVASNPTSSKESTR
jgi:hypothetical protein